MCRQAWFPPDAARDKVPLVLYLHQLEKSNGGHGNGSGWVNPETGAWHYEKGVLYHFGNAANYIAHRPAGSWGFFHTRIASAGIKDDEGCHPHVYEHGDKVVILTHNGTWSGWMGANIALGRYYPTDSAVIAALVALHGWKVMSRIDETVCAAIIKKNGDKTQVKLKTWVDTFPLVTLKNGGVASEGGKGEFKAMKSLSPGGHSLLSPRTKPLEKPFDWSGLFGHRSGGSRTWEIPTEPVWKPGERREHEILDEPFHATENMPREWWEGV